jgi:hypothetical protein
MTAHLTKQLGMAPGGEFRAAFRQVNMKFLFFEESKNDLGTKSSRL